MKIKLKLICLSAMFFSSPTFAKSFFNKTEMNLIYKTVLNSFQHKKEDMTSILCGPHECVYAIIANNEAVGVTTILKQVNNMNQAKKYIFTKDDFREMQVKYVYLVLLSSGESKRFENLKQAEVAYYNNHI